MPDPFPSPGSPQPPRWSADTLTIVEACEQRIVNAWPAPNTLIVGDWVLRMANGYSGRANSASPLRRGAELDPDLLGFVEALYRQHDLPPCVRITPLAAEGARALIEAAGFSIRDRSAGMLASLEGFAAPADAELLLHRAPIIEWIGGVASHQTGAKRNAAALAAIVRGIRLPAAFAMLVSGGRTLAYGLAVAERGMVDISSVIVDEAFRGRGVGRRLVTGLMGWAQALGCREIVLQVERGNEAAFKLYDSLGFREIYGYETWVKD